MLKIRKAKLTHDCAICSQKIHPKKHYFSLNKQKSDGTYTHGAICEACAEKIILNAIFEDT